VLETAHATPIKPKSRVNTRRYVIAKWNGNTINIM
jgi:hypothetical protein